MNIYVKEKEKPKHCTKCPFVDVNDNCYLQTEEENEMYEGWDGLIRNCPLIVIEREYTRKEV